MQKSKIAEGRSHRPGPPASPRTPAKQSEAARARAPRPPRLPSGMSGRLRAGKNQKYKSKIKGKKSSPAFFDNTELKEFLTLLSETDVVEFEYGKKDFHIVIKKDTVGEIIGDEILPPQEGTRLTSDRRQKYRIKSPAVGTFHLVENDVPLCSVGDVVKKGKKLGWVNSMGIPQDITVEKNGRIVSIFCSDSGVVEWGQDLFEIKNV